MLFLAVLGGGILVGLLLRRQHSLIKGAERLTALAIYLLLFLLGLDVGGNEAVFSRLPELGVQALILSATAIAGSVAFSALLAARPAAKGPR